MVPINRELQEIFPKLSNCELFQHLTQKDLVHLFRELKVFTVKIPKGKLFAQRGKPLDSLMVLVEGELSADILNIEGQILKVENLKAPTLVASGLLFADQNYLPVQLTALTDSEMMKIPRSELLILAGRDSRILEKLLTDSGNRIHFLAEKIRFMQMSTIEKKLCSYLTEQRNLQKSDLVQLPYSIQSLSELFGISRPSLSRSLGGLVDEGLIKREGKMIRVLDAQLLHQRCIE